MPLPFMQVCPGSGRIAACIASSVHSMQCVVGMMSCELERAKSQEANPNPHAPPAARRGCDVRGVAMERSTVAMPAAPTPGTVATPPPPNGGTATSGAPLPRVVGDGTSMPAVVRTGSGAETSPWHVLAFSGMPKLTAFRRICVVGEAATCARLVGDSCGIPTAGRVCTGNVCALPSGTVGLWRKKGLMDTLGDRAGAFVLSGRTAGVTGDHGEPQASVEQAQGDMATGDPATPGA
mmetsp:Transcript_22715/g.65483  ORF Transcript_22715/g.65483 Transcript_22715/m.65483 type:complete len:236 (-) Transcript_22715:262-969(-)